jgi:hypothetical protein
VGETALDDMDDTAPTPLSMLTADAPETAHDSVADCPLLIVLGLAVKDVIDGAVVGEEFAHDREAVGVPVFS